MRYIINVTDEDEPGAVRYWATVESLDGCHLAEETWDELVANAPAVIRDFIEVSNQRGGGHPVPTQFEFRQLVQLSSRLP